MSAYLKSNVFSDVYINGNCIVKGTITTLGSGTQWTTAGSAIYYSTGNVGVGTAAPVSPFEVCASGFPGTVLTRTAAGNNFGVGIQYSLISSTGSFRGYYARAFGGSLGTIATTNQNQANGYFGIDVANAGLFASDTVGISGIQFYVAPTISVFNTRVGIGTTNPGSLLTVSGGVGIGAGYQSIAAPTDGLIVQGNVGIGTSNPSVNALQVTGNVVTQGFTSNATNTVFNFDTLTVPFVNATQIGIGNTTPPVNLWTQGTSTTTGIGVYNADVAMILGNTAGAQNAGSIQVRASGSSSAIGATNYSLCLNPDGGNVGVGVAALSYKFHVNGGAIGVTGTNNYLYYAVTNSTASGAYMMFDAQTAGGSGRRYQIGSTGTGNNPGTGCFELYDATGSATRVVVNASGNVGIGTTNPATNLDVAKTTAAGTPAIEIRGGGGGPRLQVYGRNADPQAWMGLGTDMSGSSYEHSIYFSNANSGAAGCMTFGSYNGTTYSEKMRILVGGNVGIGVTNPVSKLTVPQLSTATVVIGGNTNWSGSSGVLKVTGASGQFAPIGTTFGASVATDNHWEIVNGNGQVGAVRTSGSTTTYNSLSDYRTKTNVQPLSNALVIISQMKPVRFNFKADLNKDIEGFIAHELQECAPNAVTGEKDAVFVDGSINPQCIDMSFLVPFLVAGMQDLSAENKDLKTQLAAMDARLAALEAK